MILSSLFALFDTLSHDGAKNKRAILPFQFSYSTSEYRLLTVLPIPPSASGTSILISRPNERDKKSENRKSLLPKIGEDNPCYQKEQNISCVQNRERPLTNRNLGFALYLLDMYNNTKDGNQQIEPCKYQRECMK